MIAIRAVMALPASRIFTSHPNIPVIVPRDTQDWDVKVITVCKCSDRIMPYPES